MTTHASLRYPGVHAREAGERPAVIMAESGEVMTYAELDAYANRLARLFRSLGLQPGDHVAYCLDNCLQCPALQWGAHYAGLYYTFLSTRLLPAEALHIVNDCGARVVVIADGVSASVVTALSQHAGERQQFTLGAPTPGFAGLDEAMMAFPALPLPAAVEGSEMLYSSGTTGRPKGIKPVLGGQPLGTTALIADFMARGFGVSSASVYLSPAPYYHAAPLKWVFGLLALGGTAVLMERFDAEGMLRAIERYRVTHSQSVPTMFHRLLSLPAEVRSRYDLSSHQVAVHAAAPCPIPTKQAMIDWWGPIVCEYYSCTESIGMTVTDSQSWLAHPGTVGRALYGTLHIVDDAGEEVPVGQDGLVYFSGTHPFSYHNDPEKTAEAYNARGWATVGDIGRVDAEGFLYLTDRKSNMIISGGVNVYPQETENVLMTHPKVFDVAVIGTPHDDLGEEVRAIVQLEPGIEASPALANELMAFCRTQLSSIKSPRAVEFRDTLPREPNGKLLKRLLRDPYRSLATALA